jgi:hypothetical protein
VASRLHGANAMLPKIAITPAPSGRPARVLIICNSPDNGGGAALLFRVTRYLDQARVRPTLFLHRDGWQAAQQRAHGFSDVVVDPDLGVLDPVPPPRLPDLRPFARGRSSGPS